MLRGHITGYDEHGIQGHFAPNVSGVNAISAELSDEKGNAVQLMLSCEGDYVIKVSHGGVRGHIQVVGGGSIQE